MNLADFSEWAHQEWCNTSTIAGDGIIVITKA
jgi:hypothetical protein